VFIENNLENHLERFLGIIEQKCPENIENLFKGDGNILLVSLKNSRFSLIETIFKLYQKYSEKLNAENSFVSKKKMNIFHMITLNKSLNIVKHFLILG
jgi:hypothetical protein